MSKEKVKITAYLSVFQGKLDKLCKKIKKARKAGELSKAHTKRLIKEAEHLKKILKDVED